MSEKGGDCGCGAPNGGTLGLVGPEVIVTGVLVLKIFIVVAIAAVGAMLAMALYGSQRPVPQGTVFSKGYAVRRYWLALVLLVAAAAFVVSMPRLPYVNAAATGRHYAVVAQQYGFAMPSVLPDNTPIVFDVTSRDVNHGFGIYDPRGRLIGQVQAMPNYVNHLAFEFHAAGHYTIRCMEYCGLGHAEMQGGFVVR